MPTAYPTSAKFRCGGWLWLGCDHALMAVPERRNNPGIGSLRICLRRQISDLDCANRHGLSRNKSCNRDGILQDERRRAMICSPTNPLTREKAMRAFISRRLHPRRRAYAGGRTRCDVAALDRVRIMRWLLGTAFLLISAPCFAADNIPPVDMGATPPVYGAPIYGGPVLPALPAYRGYGGPVYGGPMDGVTPIH